MELKSDNHVTPNQAIFLYHLRHTNIKQTWGSLEEKDGRMCALGVGMEAFGIVRNIWLWRDKHPGQPDPEDYHNSYVNIANKLDITTSDADDIVTLNDEEGLSFAEIADIFEKWLGSDRTLGLHQYWQENGKLGTAKKAFVTAWKKMQKKAKSLQTELESLTGGKLTLDELTDYDENEAWAELR